MHFAARFGLEKLAWQLLECPGSDIACDMPNINDLTPADLAEQAGHAKLAHQLRGYMVSFSFCFETFMQVYCNILFSSSFFQQMNEFTNMYSYLKIMSEGANGNTNGMLKEYNLF